VTTISQSIAHYEKRQRRERKSVKACSSCYYEEVGSLVERHPIASPFGAKGEAKP
jgi:hypothetical protein